MKKKRVILALAILGVVVLGYLSYYICCVSCVAGFVAAKLGGGKQVGNPGRVKSIIISWRRFDLHLHHWVIGFLISSVCFLKGAYVITPQLFYGFFGGLIFQGMYCYSDWHRIIRIKAGACQDNPVAGVIPETGYLEAD